MNEENIKIPDWALLGVGPNEYFLRVGQSGALIAEELFSSEEDMEALKRRRDKDKEYFKTHDKMGKELKTEEQVEDNINVRIISKCSSPTIGPRF